MSSGVNPCVYTLFSRQFRETFKKLICFRCSEITHGHRPQFRTHNFDCGAANSSTSSFRREYSYRKYETSKNVGAAENGHARGASISEFADFESADFKPSGCAKSADELTELEDLRKGLNNDKQKTNYLQWRSTWNSARYGDAMSALNARNAAKVKFRETLLQPGGRRRMPLLQDSDENSSNEKLQGERVG